MKASNDVRADAPNSDLEALGKIASKPLGAREGKMLGLFAAPVLIGTVLTFARGSLFWEAQGGATWIQGEWLSNFGGGLVRRGLSGEFIFGVSDLTGIGPLTVVSIVQITSVLAIVATVLAVLWRLRAPPALTVLALTPSFVVFWHSGDATHAKDILVLCSFVPLLLATVHLIGERPSLMASGAIFFVGAAFYEPGVLFAPALVMVAWFMADRSGNRSQFWWFSLFVGFSSVLWLGFAIIFSTVENYRLMCEPVLRHGLSEAICAKFVWFSKGIDQAMIFVDSGSKVRLWGSFAGGVGLSALPILVLSWDRRAAGRVLAPALAQTLVFLPLYVIATDYGRWLNLQVTSTLFILFAATATGHLPSLRRPKSRLIVYPLLVLALFWNLSPVMGTVSAGFAW